MKPQRMPCVIEKVSGMTYADYLKQNFFDKLGMDRTSYCSVTKVVKQRAHGYEPDSAGLNVKGYISHSWPYAAGSLCSSVGDLLKWNRALHGGQVLGPDALVAKARADLVHPLVPGTDQTLQVELLADAQVEVGVDRVHVGHERLGVGATRGVLQHRDVHFQEATFGKEPPVGLPETGASLVAAPELRVDVDVDVAPTLAVAGVVHAVGMRA